ncbi:hypothetical protein Tco_0734342 [Tanacetum coccineum]
MSMWIISRGGVLLILLGIEYRVLIDLILHRSSINNSASLSNKFGGFYFTFKFGISGLLHQVITTIADRIRGWLYSLDRHQFIFSKDVKFFESVFPFKDLVSKQADTKNVFQDLNYINFFDIKYSEIPNDDERVDTSLNSDQRSQSDSSHSFVFGEDVSTTDFSNDNSRNDAQSSDDVFVAHDEYVTTLEDNINSESNLNQNPSTST